MNGEVLKIAEAARDAGGRAMLVGGSVRDLLLGIGAKDYDLEVYGLEPRRLRELLGRFGSVNKVGEHFSVYKLSFNDQPTSSRFEVDVSIPRRESKSGQGHRGFIIEGDPGMSFEEAARRRDFTINAILYDPLTGEVVDPFGGVNDLKRRLLRAVDPATFVEDSLRVLRAVQLAARFEMTIEAATVELCRSIDLSDLPRERIWGEMEKLLLMAERPSLGLKAALDLGVLDKLFPEIKSLVGCPQEPEWHPEGDVFVHTSLSLDEAVQVARPLPKEKRIAVMLAVLCHDLGKPLTTQVIEGRIRSLGHDEAGTGPALALLDRLGVHTLNGYDVRSQVIALVRDHLRPGQFFRCRDKIKDGAFYRLAEKVDMDLLYRVARADALGRGPAASSEAQEWFIEKVRSLGVEHKAPPPILMGRHLIDAGFQPGRHFGQILRRVYEMQLDGEINTLEEAIVAARRFA